MLEQFHGCAKHIPAYKDFLRKNGVKPEMVRSYSELDDLPPVGKDSYLRKFPLEKLCYDGTLKEQSLVFTSTSGSTGAPFYFPRNGILDEQSSMCHEAFLRNSKLDSKKSTLVLVCFGMGVWIGGVITYQAFKKITERGWNLSILTPGVNKKEIFAAMKNLAPHYDQIILAGYPPFMRDVIEEGEAEGIRWKSFDMRLIFAAEAFSEDFREYLMKKTGIKEPYRHTMNIYGSADLGTMATETPLAILVRRLALKKPKLYRKLFKEAHRLPTLAQFNPHFINFEEIDGHIYITGNNILPLVRYEIGDNGGVRTYDGVAEIFKSEGFNLEKEIRKAGIKDTVTELPFVYVYERSDLSVKLYGAIIYPEHVKYGLERSARLQKYLTGKFTLFTKYDKDHGEYLELNLELRPDTKENKKLAKEVIKCVSASLAEKSAEHKNNFDLLGNKVLPRVVFWPHGHPEHFQTGIKQKWVKR